MAEEKGSEPPVPVAKEPVSSRKGKALSRRGSRANPWRETMVRRLFAGGSRIRTFRSSPDQCLSELVEPCAETTWRARGEFLRGGTVSSNPSPSSGESVSRPKPLSYVENPGFPRGCARLAWRLGRQRRAGCFDTAATGGNISVGPYSSTAVPLTGSVGMPDGPNEVGAFSGLDRALDLKAERGPLVVPGKRQT
jgi:hypothetical protein